MNTNPDAPARRAAPIRIVRSLLIAVLAITVLLGAAVGLYLYTPRYAGGAAAQTMATAISWPRQDSAAGLTRAALASNSTDDRFAVLEAEDLPREVPQDLNAPMARLVFLFRVDEGHATEWLDFRQPLQDGCWEALFNYYGAIGRPRRVRCPVDATAIVPPPAPPQPRVDEHPGG